MSQSVVAVTVGGSSVDSILAMDGTRHEGVCGGNAFFSAAGAAHWLDPSSIAITTRHGDDFPEGCRQGFRDAGFDMSGVTMVAGLSSHGFVARYDDQEVRTLAVADESRNEAEPGDLAWPFGVAVPELDPVLGDDMLAGWPALSGAHIAPIGRDAIVENLDLLGARGAWRQVDPGEESIAWSADDRARILAGIDAYMPSRHEVGIEGDSWLDVCRTIAGQGPSVVAIRLGREGSFVFDCRTGQGRHVPAIPITPIDPTGAGDAYCGGFLAGIVLTGDANVAALLATVAAASAVETVGAVSTIRDDATTRERLRWLSALTEQPLPSSIGGS